MFSKYFLVYFVVLVCLVTAEDNSSPSLTIAEKECQKIINAPIEPKPLKVKYIIGGIAVKYGEFPHMVALGYEDLLGFKFDCGGSLISNRYVVTAAHCVDRIEPAIIRMGVSYLGSLMLDPDTDVRVEKIIKHPGYNPASSKYNDIALIELTSTVEFDDTLKPVCLYTKDTDPVVPLTVTGWGTTNTTEQTRSNILLKAEVLAVPIDRCNDSYPIARWRKLPHGIVASQLCAADPKEKRDACQGDSGGPLTIASPDGESRLVGVTSFGRGCASSAPGVYTRLSYYRDWIESVVWPSNSK